MFIKNVLFIILLILNCGSNLYSQKILVVDSYHKEYLWTADCRKGFEEFIDSQCEIIYLEMDTKRIPPVKFETRAYEIWKKIVQINPDLILTMDDNALKYLGEKCSSNGFPVVFMGINNNPRNYFTNNLIPQNVTGILERPLLKRSLLSISSLISVKNSRILLMMDNGITSEAIIHTLLHDELVFEMPGFTVDTWLTGSYSSWQSKLLSVTREEYDAIIIANYAGLKDSLGNQIPLNIISDWTGRNTSVPVFAFWKYSVGKGKAIGGLLTDGYIQGKEAALLCNRVLLNNERPPKPVIPEEGTYLYSRYELERWEINLPQYILEVAEFTD